MTYKDFKQEVTNNRPRLALVYLVPVLDELYAEIESLKEAACHCACLPDCCEKTDASATAKKAATKKTPAAKKESEETVD